MSDEVDKARVDWFMADIFVIGIEITDAMRANLLAEAARYIRANGSLPWDKWSLLSDFSRKVFEEAAKHVEILADLSV